MSLGLITLKPHHQGNLSLLDRRCGAASPSSLYTSYLISFKTLILRIQLKKLKEMP